MAEREFKVEPYGVEMTCGADGCEGIMLQTGEIDVINSSFPHKCDKCGRLDSFLERYPVIRYRKMLTA